MSVSFRLALFYGAYFFFVGIQLPFWPVWLASRGVGPGEIGLILASSLWLKVCTNPLAGWLADRSGNRKGVMIALAAGAVAGGLIFIPAYGFWPLLAINGAASAAFSALMPLGDNLTMTIANE